MADASFDAILESQAESFIQELEKAVKLKDRAASKAWVRDKLSKGFNAKIILVKLKEYSYDFNLAGRYFDDISAGKDKAEEALKEVQKMRDEKDRQEKEKKWSTKIGLILSAFMTGGVGFFTWKMMSRSTEGIGDVSMMGSAGTMLTSFSKGSFILGVAGVLVGLILSVIIGADYFRKRAKERKVQQQAVGEKMQEMENRLSVAQQAAGQRIEPPKLV